MVLSFISKVSNVPLFLRARKLLSILSLDGAFPLGKRKQYTLFTHMSKGFSGLNAR